MKASRVSSTTSSTFRNNRPVNQVNDTFYQPGEEYRHQQQHTHEQFKKELKTSKDTQQQHEAEQINHVTLEDLESENNVPIDKQLDDKLKKIEEINKKKMLAQKYKSSI